MEKIELEKIGFGKNSPTGPTREPARPSSSPFPACLAWRGPLGGCPTLTHWPAPHAAQPAARPALFFLPRAHRIARRTGPQHRWLGFSSPRALSLTAPRPHPSASSPFFPFFFPELPFSSPVLSFLRPPSALLGWKATAVTRTWQVTNPARFPSYFRSPAGL